MRKLGAAMLNKQRLMSTCVRASAILLVLFCAGCSIPRIVIINDPLSASEHNDLGRIYESQGKTDLAMQQYHAALNKDPKSISSLLLLGTLAFRTKDFPEAESAFSRAIRLQPENGDHYNNLSLIYLEEDKKRDESEELVRKALTLSPDKRAYYLDTLGLVLMRQGRGPEAITALLESVALIPPDQTAYRAEAYGHLADAYREIGNRDLAEKAEQQAAHYRKAPDQ